jgi:hypothetical protein
VRQVFKAAFALLILITFVMLVGSAYRAHHVNLRLARLGDVASSIATELTLDTFAHEDRAYVVNPSKFWFQGIRTIGGENYELRIGISTINGIEFGEAGVPKGVASARVVVPVLVFERGSHVPGKLEVSVWYA